MANNNDVRIGTIFRLSSLVWLMFWVIEIFLGLRFILRVVGANPTAGFTQFVYDLSYPFVRPFINVVSTVPVESVNGIGVFDWNILIAMMVYLLVAETLVKLLAMMMPIDRNEAENAVRHQSM